MELKDLVGEHVLTGVDSGVLKSEDRWESDATTLMFVLDGKTYLVTEDPSDGYRSSMGDIELVEVEGRKITNTFAPVAVIGRYIDKKAYDGYGSGYECDILELVDAITGKIVLELGTDNTDDYYPSYVGNFCPENMACNQ